MAASKPSERELALADMLARWATQPVLRKRLIASLNKKPLDTVADLVGVEARALRGKRRSAATLAAARLGVLLQVIGVAEENSKIEYRLTAGTVRQLFVPYAVSLAGTLGPLEPGAGGTATGQSGNAEICLLRTEEVEQRYRDLQEAVGRWDNCAAEHTDSLADLETTCLAELMNLWAAGDAYLTALYLKEIACSGVRE